MLKVSYSIHQTDNNNSLMNQQVEKKQNGGVILVNSQQELTKNKLLTSTMHFLITNLLCEFNSHNYDSNKIMRVAIEKVKHEPENQDKELILQIWPDIELLMWNLTVSPKYWVQMFENEQFYSIENESIDLHVFTTKIYKRIIKEASNLTNYAGVLSEMIGGEIFMFLQEVSSQVCDSYQRGREIIMSETKLMQQLIKQSPIVNFYFIYKLLLEISTHCSQKIMEDLSTSIFRNIEATYSRSFADYILEKHEVLSLCFTKDRTKTKSHDQSLIDIMERIKHTNNLKWREGIRQDGQTAIIIEFQNEQVKGAKPENYMIKMDKQGRIKVLNCNTLRMKWMVTQSAEKNYDILNIVSDKGKLAKRLRNSPTKLKDITLVDHFSTVGGALGKCLADIRKYDSVGDFIFDFSKKSVINGSFNYIASNIPLLGILLATGGYTYTMFSIFSNKVVNKKKKFQQVGYLTFDIASSFGTGVLGAVVGQTLIPIPFLGAFVGGFVGSFVGELGGKVITNKLQSLRFKEIIEQLQVKIQPGGYWQVNKETLSILGLNRQHFYQTIPCQIQQRLGCDKIWYAMIGFTILSFHQSKKRAKFLKEKMKLIQKQKENENFSEEDMQKDLHYQPSSDIICIMKYFNNNNIDILYCFKQLEEFVTNIFSVME